MSRAGQTLPFGGDMYLQFLLKLHKITQVDYSNNHSGIVHLIEGAFQRLSVLVNTLSVI